jgi:hypothetical protein
MTVGRLLNAFGRDFYYSVRSLRRRPGLLVVSALSLGLGIGVNTVLYMGISKIYESQPTMYEPKRVVGVELGTGSQFSYPDYKDLSQNAIFERALGFRTTALNFGPTGHVQRVRATLVTGNYFEVLGVSPELGRTFSATEMRPETEPRVVVVTSGFLHDHLKGDGTSVGKSIILDCLGHALPVLRPARALLARIPLGLRPWLHRLRGRLPGLVRRLLSYYGGV